MHARACWADIGVLSEEFLLGLKNNPHKSLAVEALK